MENKKGFTLIEVLVSIILAGIIVYFLYTMMLASYQSYRNLSSVSKQTSDIRVCEAYLRKSIRNACYIYIDPNPTSSQATAISFGRQDIYWNTATSNIQRRYIVDRYVVKDSTNPVKTGRFYKDDIYFGNQIPNPRDTTREGSHELLLQVYYTGPSYSIVGQPLIREEQILSNLRVAYYYMPSNTEGGVNRFTIFKIGLDFDEPLPTGETIRHTRLLHCVARGFGLP